METTRARLLYIVVGFTIAYLLMGASSVAAQGDCRAVEKVLADAFSKVHNIPTHVYTTTKIGGQTLTSEIIYAGGSMYMKISGKWTLAGSIRDMEQTEQQARHNANSKETCRSLNDEPINGEMAIVYSSHSETPKGNIDMKMWVSKAKGLLLRQDTNSEGGKAVNSSRYEYENVKAPL